MDKFAREMEYVIVQNVNVKNLGMELPVNVQQTRQKNVEKLQIRQFVVIVEYVHVIGVYVKKDMEENIVIFVSLVQVKFLKKYMKMAYNFFFNYNHFFRPMRAIETLC